MILDGGLATELERMGCNLDHPLWSAHIVFENPDAIKQVHLSYLEAGADIIMTSSYQASFPGCTKEGMSEQKVIKLLRKTVEIAVSARDEFLENKPPDRVKPLIAASIGSYGAYLANGAEYSGEYSVSKEKLYDFHIKRWEILADTDADLMACETIPSFEEAIVLSKIIERSGKQNAFVSFSCRDGEHISDGTPIKECTEMLANNEKVWAIGLNCTAPRFVSELIEKVREAAPKKQVIVYPNSGEIYDSSSKSWNGISNEKALAEMTKEWFSKGATIIGGCCRTKPSHIRAIRKALVS